MKKTIDLGPKLKMPLSAVTQKVNILGMSGSGKSNCGGLAAEQMLQANVQVVWFDPKHEAYGLRLAADGKTPSGFNIPVFGGAKGDVPLKADLGKRIAELIVSQDYSAIIDTSDFDSDEKAQFCADWATRFLQMKIKRPGAVALFLDEAEEYIPENPMSKLEHAMLKAFMKVQKQGRSKGIGLWPIGQRPQEISKAVLNLAETYIIFRTGGIQERDTIKNLIGRKDKEFLAVLDAEMPALETGTALIWSPSFLKVRDHFEVSMKTTFDTGATPEVGARKVEARPLSPIDLQQVTEAMADVVEEAEQNDPEKLQAMLTQTKRELTAANNRAEAAQRQIEALGSKPAAKPKEVPAIKDAQILRIEQVVRSIEASNANASERAKTQMDGIAKYVEDYRAGEVERVGQLQQTAKELVEALDRIKNTPPNAVIQTAPISQSPQMTAPRSAPRPAPIADSSSDGTVRDNLGDKQKMMIDTLLTFETLGTDTIDRAIVGTFIGMSSKGGSFKTYLSALNQGKAGKFPQMVEYRPGNCVTLTEAGRTAARSTVVINSVSDLHQAWKDQLKNQTKAQMLECVIAAHPFSVSREDLAKYVNMSAAGGSFKTYLSSLRALGIVDYVNAKGADGESIPSVKATDLVFPDSLA